MRRFFILMAIFAITAGATAQLRINCHGMVDIHAQTQDWWSGLKVNVPTYNSCAYHLTYNAKDRFFVHASGYLWCERGGYFGSDILYKENIRPIESALNKVICLQGVRYQYKERTEEEIYPCGQLIL